MEKGFKHGRESTRSGSATVIRSEPQPSGSGTGGGASITSGGETLSRASIMRSRDGGFWVQAAGEEVQGSWKRTPAIKLDAAAGQSRRWQSSQHACDAENDVLLTTASYHLPKLDGMQGYKRHCRRILMPRRWVILHSYNRVAICWYHLTPGRRFTA